jgi:hypothetical protein
VPAVVAEEPVAPESPPHTAPHDEIINVVRDLIERSPARPVTLDSLANALKARGFSRPPGSPRLITRLRRIKEINLSRAGVITLYGSGHPAAGHAAASHPPASREARDRELEIEATAAAETEATSAEADVEAARADVEEGPARRVEAAGSEAAATVEEEDEGPGPGNEAVPRQQPSRAAPPSRRRRSRRGGRGRRQHPQAAPAV